MSKPSVSVFFLAAKQRSWLCRQVFEENGECVWSLYCIDPRDQYNMDQTHELDAALLQQAEHCCS
jgi:hypothetical protein